MASPRISSASSQCTAHKLLEKHSGSWTEPTIVERNTNGGRQDGPDRKEQNERRYRQNRDKTHIETRRQQHETAEEMRARMRTANYMSPFPQAETRYVSLFRTGGADFIREGGLSRNMEAERQANCRSEVAPLLQQ